MAAQQPPNEKGKPSPSVVAVVARPTAAPAAKPAAVTKPLNPVMHFLRTSRTLVLLVLAIALLGAAPAALTGAYVGLWKLPFLPPSATAIPTTSQKDVALPRAAWVATSAAVHAQPGTGDPIATLGPGYPVTLLAQRSVGTTLWTQIKWTGPTAKSGGQGWATSSAFTSYGAGTAPVADLGAFSSTLANATAAQGAHLSVSLYFPKNGYLFQQNATQAVALGDGLRSPLLIATLASAEQATTPTSVSLATLVQIAGGNATNCAAAYAQLGGNSGMATYFSQVGVPGVQLASGDWSGAKVTATSLLVFYESLREGRLLTNTDRVLAIGLLQSSDQAVITAVGGATPLAGKGPLFVGFKQQASGWTVSAVGVATNPGGEDYTVAAVASDLPTEAAAEQALAGFFQSLAPLVA